MLLTLAQAGKVSRWKRLIPHVLMATITITRPMTLTPRPAFTCRRQSSRTHRLVTVSRQQHRSPDAPLLCPLPEPHPRCDHSPPAWPRFVPVTAWGALVVPRRGHRTVEDRRAGRTWGWETAIRTFSVFVALSLLRGGLEAMYLEHQILGC